MSWACGTNYEGRDVGYGVPAYCDHPGCTAEIDRGISYTCGQEPDGGEEGCGRFFCDEHLAGLPYRCERCRSEEPPFAAKPDHPKWLRWKLRDFSWREWRTANPQAVEAIRAALRK